MAAEKPLSIAMHGATGRMGTRIVHLMAEDPTVVLGGTMTRADPGGSLGEGVDVVIDFSAPEATMGLLRRCVEGKLPLVVGTTGFDADQRRELDEAAGEIPLFVASNFSKAVNLLFRLAGEAARVLGQEADVEIVERHHHFKKDAPSGTALTLAESVTRAIGPRPLVHGRSGQVGERPRGEIGMHALRSGDNPGEHTVVFGLLGECLELSHRALNRDGFARGAIDAAKFLAAKPPGRYTMADLLTSGVVPRA